jgi:hypothetical protein
MPRWSMHWAFHHQDWCDSVQTRSLQLIIPKPCTCQWAAGSVWAKDLAHAIPSLDVWSIEIPAPISLDQNRIIIRTSAAHAVRNRSAHIQTDYDNLTFNSVAIGGQIPPGRRLPRVTPCTELSINLCSFNNVPHKTSQLSTMNCACILAIPGYLCIKHRKRNVTILAVMRWSWSITIKILTVSGFALWFHCFAIFCSWQTLRWPRLRSCERRCV